MPCLIAALGLFVSSSLVFAMIQFLVIPGGKNRQMIQRFEGLTILTIIFSGMAVAALCIFELDSWLPLPLVFMAAVFIGFNKWLSIFHVDIEVIYKFSFRFIRPTRQSWAERLPVIAGVLAGLTAGIVAIAA